LSLNPAMFASDDEGWLTPEPVIAALEELGPTALDPCAAQHSLVEARKRYQLPDRDGLLEQWIADAPPSAGHVFLNPPYGRVIGKWIEKAIEQARLGCEIVMLVPARVDARWFQRAVSSGYVQRICFWRGRLQFVGAMSSAPFPSALLYSGPFPQAFSSAMQSRGLIMQLCA
jgi:phage N-6-adenine-methyltransferase